MRRPILATILTIVLCLQAKGQVFIINDNLTNSRMSEIKAAVVDSTTNEPIAFASFYVIPAKDTTISNFTLTDAEGKAKLEEVPYGEYVLHVEMLGYKPFTKQRYFRERNVDIGTIKLQIDENYLKAAVVSDVGNPIVVKKDTVEFNASSFQVGTNSMLRDLLKRMPGMEITDDGKVTFNGEAIDKLTVGGRTFFFDDQSTALNNLPASIVDKVRVIDRESENTRDTGVQDGTREKVLDVALKKEYEKGWFGNAGIKGGTTFASDKDDPLRDDRGLLYSGNALVSAYSEKDQVTVIANGMNINDSNGVVFVAVSSDGTRRTNLNQISSAAQLGVNANTSRIKNFETTVGGNYKYGDSRSGSKSFRTTHQEDGDILTSSEDSGREFSNSLSANGEFKKEKGRLRVRIGPRFSYSRDNNHSSSSSQTLREGTTINSSTGDVHSLSTSRATSNYTSVTLQDLFGKKGRSISLSNSISYSNSNGESNENSLVSMLSGDDVRSLKYLNDQWSSRLTGSVGYTEPVGEKILIAASTSASYSRSNRISDAFDANGRNDYFSSESNNLGLIQSNTLTFQYKFTKDTWLTLGAEAEGVLNETFSKSFGISQTTGEGEWYWHVAPRIRFQHTAGNNRFTINTYGSSREASNSLKLATMSITDPSRPSIGNIYLKPYGETNINLSLNRNNREKFSTLMVSMYGDVQTNPITYARWYDSDGIYYSIPVNSRRNTLTATLYSNYTTPLDGKKRFFLTIGLSGSARRSTNYQPTGALDGLDKDSFDYSAFMESFWGDGSGDRFYNGKSGFAESNTTTFSPSMTANLRYSGGEGFSGSINAGSSREIARYSLDPTLNLNTVDNRIGARANYATKHEFEFATDLAYHWYIGYPTGYGAPEWQWNGEISKNVKAFTLSLKVHDILDQTRNLTHTVTANYEEDTYTLVMGRYILFGLKWNFGKMNAAHNQRAQNAAWQMVF